MCYAAVSRGVRYFGLLLLLAACSDDSAALPDAGPTPEDAGVNASLDDDAGASCDLAFEESSLGDGHVEPLGAGSGEVRAGILGADDLPDDPSDLLTWAAGDFVLANDRVAFVIEAAGASDGYDPFGGKPVGIASVADGTLVRPADFNEIIAGIGRYVLDPERVGVLADGTDGEAIVRAEGSLVALPFVADLARALAPGLLDDQLLRIDYVLGPQSDSLEVRFRVHNPRPRPAAWKQLFVFFQDKRMRAFAPPRGFLVDPGDSPPWLAFAEEDATSYAVESLLEESPTLLASISGAAVMTGDNVRTEACSEGDVAAFRVIAGGPGADGVQQAIRRVHEEPERTVTGTVTREDGSPGVGVRVHLESADGEQWLTRVRTGSDGTFVAHVPEGVDLRVRTWEPAVGRVEPVAVDGPLELSAPSLGTLSVTTEPVGPARISIRPVDGVTSPPDRFGEDPWSRGRSHVEFPADGSLELELPVGEYQVTVSRGFEWELADAMVEVRAGEEASFGAILDHVVETPGVLCGDFHIHTSRSPDAGDDARVTLAAAAADGLELPTRSDHEWVYSWDEIAVAQGLGEYVYGVPSLELTTFAWGHFGVVPLAPRPELPNRGSIDWIDRAPTDVFDDARATDLEPVVIINHPRGAAISGYFTAAEYDPVTGTVGKPELWDERFVAVEVFNSSSFRRAEELVEDWFSLIRHGRRVWAVGSSDSHGLKRSPIGYPRTCLEVGADDTESLRDGGGLLAVRDALRDGHFTVSGGIQVDALAGEAGPGDTVTAAAAEATIQASVRAPSWVDVVALEVYVDGELHETIDLSTATEVVRLDEELTVPVGEDGAWVVLHAYGEDDLHPVHTGREPFGVTMPIFFER